MMEQVLLDTNVLAQLPLSVSTSPSGPLKRNSALTVRPTIGEERKAWLLEAQRAYCFNELQMQTTRFFSSASAILHRKSTTNSRDITCQGSLGTCSMEVKSVSCPDLEARNDQRASSPCDCERVSVAVNSCEVSPVDTSSLHEDIDDDEDRQRLVLPIVDEKDSCEFLFQHMDVCFKPSKIRLSPRIEKLGNEGTI